MVLILGLQPVQLISKKWKRRYDHSNRKGNLYEIHSWIHKGIKCWQLPPALKKNVGFAVFKVTI